MEQKIGRCSLCGGDVVAFRGAWGGITPPPPARCSSCGAVEDDGLPTIKMQPRAVHNPATRNPLEGWPMLTFRTARND